MSYDKETLIEEVRQFKRRDPSPVMSGLGWEKKPGSYKARYINSDGKELDLWGGSDGNFFAFSTPGVRSRFSILDLALRKVGGAARL